MKLLRVAARSVNDVLYFRQLNQHMMLRNLSTNSDSGSASNANNTNNANDANNNVNPFESPDDFERRIFGGPSDDSSNAFFRKIDKAHSGLGTGSSMSGDGSGFFDDDSLNSLTDGMEGRLKKAATYFEVNPQEIASEDFTYRPDMNFKYSGMTYTPEDLNLKKPGFWKPGKRSEFEVTTKEVLKNADFRNVRFLANFLTEAGIIIKRSKTGISAKAQRKIAREIKTARAFGLLPFTTMGTKSFVFGKTMEDLDHDFELDRDSRLDADDLNDPIAE